jgi:lipopolysaccharide export system permease protein
MQAAGLMNVLHRYVFRRLLSAFLIAAPVLTISIWLTQVLPKLNLVTDRGQSFGVFLEAVAFVLPPMIVIIGPATMLIVVITTINWLNADSEFVSIAASGGAPSILLRPVLALALAIALVAAACSLYLGPIAARANASLIEEVNANVISTLIRPGQFQDLGDDVVFQAAAIHADGTLEGIFVFDRRQPDESVAYIANAGAMVENEFGQFLLMQDGVIQRRSTEAASVSTIQFRSYALDLTTLGSQSVAESTRPNERGLGYLLDPDPDDPIHQANPYRYTAELHNRIAVPLYSIALALLPLAMLGGVRSTRQESGKLSALAWIAGAAVLVTGISLQGPLERQPFLATVTYGLPVGVIALSLIFIWSGRRLPSIGRRRHLRTRAAGPAGGRN